MHRFLIDMFNGSVPTELARKSNLLMEYARARNATIFHLCYGCFVPLDERNDDTPIREAVAAIPECSIPPTRPDGGIPFCSNERVHVRLWPFRQRATHGGVTLEEGCDLMANDQLTFLQRQQCNYGDVSSNTLRQPRDNHPFILDPALTIRPQDVVTESTDWVFRVLKHRNISNLVFFGVDANECVLFSRDLSLLSMLSMGWPADHVFAVPELGFSSYQVQGIWVSWEKHGAYLWASALMQNFEVRSLSLNGTRKGDGDDTLEGVCLFELETFV